jgi:hypothetical protein
VCDLARVRHDAIKKYAGGWKTVCEEHVEIVWGTTSQGASESL